MQVRNELDQLLEAIKNAEVTRHYEQMRMKIDQDAYLRQQINELRRKNHEMQTRTFPEQLFDATENFRQEHIQFFETPIVEEYFNAELAYCRMLQAVMGEIAGIIAVID